MTAHDGRKAPRRSTAPRIERADQVPAPVEHRGPDRTRLIEDGGTRYLMDLEQPDAWLAYSGCISEVVR